MKYAKWKAVEIDRCLKNDITPTPGPGDQGVYYPPPPGPGDAASSYTPLDDKPVPKPRQNIPPPSYPPDPQNSNPPSYDPANVGFRYDQTGGETGSSGFLPSVTYPPRSVGGVASGGMAPSKAAAIGPDEVLKVQKLCKFASSALDYEDSAGAMEYLENALHLLKTGTELK